MKTISNNYQDKFNEQITLLRVLCECYDAGNEVLALSIATSLRVLMHDTKRSTSLLENIDKKKAICFISTNVKIPNESIHLGLVRRVNVGVKDGFGGEAKYWPLCDKRYFPSPSKMVMLTFDDWWQEQIFSNGTYSLTRKDLVIFIANKDGGAHVDREVEDRYDKFRKSWSGGSTLVGSHSGQLRGYDNIPTYPAIRQIAYELMQSLSV